MFQSNIWHIIQGSKGLKKKVIGEFLEEDLGNCATPVHNDNDNGKNNIKKQNNIIP